MGENTAIEWADHTFNPWIGCTKVSPACDHCYAERLATARLGVAWGPHADRRRTAESTWRQPLAWNRKAEREGKRPRVFCASLADVFDNSVDPYWREDLWALIHDTPHLDWLLLTKRPQNIIQMLPGSAPLASETAYSRGVWGEGWANVWLGTTVENQAEADRRIPHLLAVPAAKRFLSCEPLLGPVNIGEVPAQPGSTMRALWGPLSGYCSRHYPRMRCGCRAQTPSIDWVIAGGESGPEARPSHPDWFRSLRDQCRAAGVPFFFKQWGDLLPGEEVRDDGVFYIRFPDGEENHLPGDGWDIAYSACLDHRGAPQKVWREYWASGDGRMVKRLGKAAAGARLDGREHREVPGA